MKLLLDTHVLLWFLNDSPQLTSLAKGLIENPSTQKFVSIASCWEIAIKVGLKKLELGESTGNFLARELTTNGFELLPIKLHHVALVETMTLHHRDPFDRMLVAQAKLEELILVSCDEIFEQYGIPRKWN